MDIKEIILIIACSIFVISVITISIINKKKGKSCCSEGCSGCNKCQAIKDDFKKR